MNDFDKNRPIKGMERVEGIEGIEAGRGQSTHTHLSTV